MIPMFNFVKVVEANQLTFPTKTKTRHHVDVVTWALGRQDDQQSTNSFFSTKSNADQLSLAITHQTMLAESFENM